ncbi:MAG: 2-polyprenyl-3-methyl-5-hydroxy-6-metoxy-1,4-benzoquinol methylase [Paraglaciecola psychrophila]|jgi:2-polyprenyl-3-methyl-5-hydroxy-6-metoxy-1,4-benzoquinol methylase
MSNADNNLVTGAAATEAAAAAIAGSEEPSIDTILANIRAEADQLQRQGLLAPQLDTAEVNWGAFLPEESALPIKRQYAKSEFLIFEDVNFVNNAYLGVLQRAADETGLEDNIRALRSGLGKEQILLSLLNSDEGQRIGIIIDGLGEVDADPDPELDDSFPLKSHYHSGDFLVCSDVDFIDNAYLGILQRLPDESGLSSLQHYLAAGGFKEIVLVNLLRSAEAQERKVVVAGLLFYRFLGLLFTVPLLGRLFHSVAKRLRRFHRRPGTERDIVQRRAQLFQDKFGSLVNSQALQVDIAVSEIVAHKKNIRELVGALKRQYETVQKDMSATRADNQQLAGQLAASELRAQQLHRDMQLSRNDLSYQRAQLQQLMERLASPEQPLFTRDSALQIVSDSAKDRFDAYYVAFESECRGTLEEIHEAQSVYLPVLAAADCITAEKPLLDIGCGRGEWLQIVSSQGLSCEGVDINRVMVQQCQQQGLQANLANALDSLRSRADGSLGAVTGFHIIEHLPFEELFDLFAEALRALVPGGLIIFETPNPENMMVATHTFYHDPTHRNPVTPTGIDFLARYIGFSDCEIMRLHPYPEEAKIKGIDQLTSRVNGHFCGPQDFAIIARKPV